MKITLNLTIEEVNTVMLGLSELTFKSANPVITNILNQSNACVNAGKAPPSIEDSPITETELPMDTPQIEPVHDLSLAVE
jgi:hypothetical protein